MGGAENNCILTDVFTWSLSGFLRFQFSACGSKSASWKQKGYSSP